VDDVFSILASARDCENCENPSSNIFLGQYERVSSSVYAVEFVANQRWKYLQIACSVTRGSRDQSSSRFIRIAGEWA